MGTSGQPGLRVTSAGVRRLTKAISLLAVIVGPLLYLFPDRTDTLFAWTINPPVTAAFLGGSYATALVLELLAARERVWTRARVVYPAMLLFTTLTLIATLIHLDKFHFNGSDMALVTAWAWLIIYIVAPPVMLLLLISQLRAPGIELPRKAPLAGWFRAFFALQGAVMIGLGAGLFIAPAATSALWPWSLTPLTARAVGAWLLGLGLASAQSAWENDWERVYMTLAGDVTMGLLQLLAVVRFSSSIDWSKSNGAIYVAVLAIMCALGVYGLYVARRYTRPSPAFTRGQEESSPA